MPLPRRVTAAIIFSLATFAPISAQETKPLRPTLSIGFDELQDSAEYPEPVAAIIRRALSLAEDTGHLPYKFGGARPSDGGFDCSGAMHYLLGKFDLQPPRTSAQQFIWTRDAGNAHVITEKVTSLDDEAFSHLRPGSLLFWSGTYVPTDGREVKITHVGLYLGRAAKDGRHLMVCSSSGRSYRGRRCTGFGVYDFRLPSRKSRAKFVAYGSIPGLQQSDKRTK